MPVHPNDAEAADADADLIRKKTWFPEWIDGCALWSVGVNLLSIGLKLESQKELLVILIQGHLINWKTFLNRITNDGLIGMDWRKN